MNLFLFDGKVIRAAWRASDNLPHVIDGGHHWEEGKPVS
jgi:hypothetical protein